ncbi:MAG: cytidine deaminase [Lachnospiraceae bacterium]|nr:cytidine deaminase [Lachnospiraceae bacterium]
MINTDALIFDIDGTLWDTTKLCATAWNKAIEGAGFKEAATITADRLKGLFGLTMDVIADAVLPEMSADKRKALLSDCIFLEQKILSDNTEDLSYEGISDVIKELSSYLPVCIASNSQAGYPELVIKKLGLSGYIFDHICFGDTGFEKDANIRLLCEKWGFKSAVYIGDIQKDMDAAVKAGAAFIHAAYGFGTAKDPDAVIKSPRDILSVISFDKKSETDIRDELIKKALDMRVFSYAPYSDYQVGAALLTAGGRIYTGCNVENASYGAANCAERTAVFKAVSEGMLRFKAIAIAGGSGSKMGMAYPCGICRQVLREFSDPSELKIYVASSLSEYMEYTLEELLPESFGPDFKSSL